MSYQYLLQLPQHLEPALKAGKIFVESGVARDISNKAIVAHLEMVAPQAIGALGMSNPYAALAGIALKTVSDTSKLNKIISLTQEIKMLSTVNLAISGVTLGVVVAGFAIVLHKLNKIDKKLDKISLQIQALDVKVSDLVKNETSKLIADVKRYVKHCITLIHQLEDLGWSEHLDTETSKLLDNIEVLVERILGKYLDRDGINVSLELAQCLQGAYANLLKAYLTKRYLQQKSLDYPALRLQTLISFSQQLCAPELLDELYEEYLVSKEHRFSEAEIDIILALYRYGCQQTSNNVNVHYEILKTTPVRQFKGWQKLLKASDQPLIWLEHRS
ncbi:hypothetical protein [Nodosilinea sp. FACHB-13]|uniref:hypothetical protein n=1 Tax=Cyanophyceae TaxID=3028117 RepID=UPI001684B814|nr:hypothetical protein [Nodosilinea sp. FACHB-13]MBD2107047.1 hypothetical protein [Nodosilinea sp. FACHB-13]